MPWPRDHKSQTRDRIVATAARALRAKGIAGVGVADVMSTAGLTHGGFYAHFKSKDELLSEAIEHANRKTLAGLSGRAESADAGASLRAVVDAYLSPRHAAQPEVGCPVAAIGSEGARAGGKVRRNLARTIRARVAWLRDMIPASGRDEQAVGAMACMVGGLIIARALAPKEAEEVLEACREFLHRALGDESQ